MHAICPTLSRSIHERTAKIFFERFNAAGYTLLERPLAQLYAANATSGLVVDVDRFKTDVVPIVDCLVQHNARITIPVGLADCERYLAHLWRTGANQTVLGSLGLEEGSPELDAVLLELASHVLVEGLVRVPGSGETAEAGTDDAGVTDIAAVLVAGREKAVIEAGTKKKRGAHATAAEREREREIAALDLVTVPFRGIELTLGRERHRICEPLFDPTLLKDVPGSTGKDEQVFEQSHERFVSLQQAAHLAVMQLDVPARTIVLDGLFVAGDLGNARGKSTFLRLSALLIHVFSRSWDSAADSSAAIPHATMGGQHPAASVTRAQGSRVLCRVPRERRPSRCLPRGQHGHQGVLASRVVSCFD